MSTDQVVTYPLDFEQRARACRLEENVGDDEYTTAAEIIWLRDINAALLAASKALLDARDHDTTVAATMQIRAAVAKAEGRS